MSIYSGFATRFQEQSYDNCIDSLLYLLQKRIIKFYQNDQADEEKFISLVLRLHQQMRTMEKNKYLQPKSSQSVNQLIKFMTVFKDNLSSHQQLRNQQLQIKRETPKIEQKPVSLPEVTLSNKKKSQFWVQKPQIEITSNKDPSQKQFSTINKNTYEVNLNDANIQLRKTAYDISHLRGVKLKDATKANFYKRNKEQGSRLGNRLPKSRAMSNHISPSQTYQIKKAEHVNSFRDQGEKNRKKQFSNIKIQNQTHEIPDDHSEVADIIKEYILKAKKNHLRGSRNVNYYDLKDRGNNI